MFDRIACILLSTLLFSSIAKAATFEFETLEVFGEDITFSASFSITDDQPFFVEADVNFFEFGDFLNPIINTSPNLEFFELAYDYIGGSGELRVTPDDFILPNPDIVELLSFSGDFEGGGSLLYTNTESGAIGGADTFLGLWRIEFPSDRLLGAPTITAVTGRFVAVPTAVPEPSTLAIMLLAIAGMMLSRYRVWRSC
ncbi:MAG: PEP-CTERM sorting domain-containing protein [Pseudomonadota bacterium]